MAPASPPVNPVSPPLLHSRPFNSVKQSDELRLLQSAIDFFLFFSSPPKITAGTRWSEEGNHQRCSFPGDEKQGVLSLLPDGALSGDGKRKRGATLPPTV